MISNSNTYPRYSMHKYWGKKPANGLGALIEKYTNEGDIVLDPFSGYGVFCCEAFLRGRNVIANDLNPIANFISKNLISTSLSVPRVMSVWERIRVEFERFVEGWYCIVIDDVTYNPISVLRTKENVPIEFTYKDVGTKRNVVKKIPEKSAKEFLEFEQEHDIKDWFPTDTLIENSRISVSSQMKVCDLFTKRTLACHARLYSLILKYSEGEERDLLLLAFTANLANCSKLVPPIKSRGRLSQGAWMTGFYIGKTYIENNVLHYFENRLKKAIRGKTDFLSTMDESDLCKRIRPIYKITNEDAKKLSLPSRSVDYVFTDLPYGDSVPYFEQSAIWNSWLKFPVDYENEVVISDSRSRNKDIKGFESDVNLSISEICRVLKDGGYFSLTFHSLSGLEWKSVTNACILNNFILIEYSWLEQKTYPPRQLNRLKSIKGDVLVTFQKKISSKQPAVCDSDKLVLYVVDLIRKEIKSGASRTNEIMMSVMECVLRNMLIIGDVDVFRVLSDNFVIDKYGKWYEK